MLFFALSTLTLIFSSVLGPENVKPFNIIINVALFIFCVVVALFYIAKDRMYLLTPIVWYYLACAAYYGLGPLAWYFANFTTVSYIDGASGNPIDDIAVFDTNALCIYGMTAVALTLFFLDKFFSWEKSDISQSLSKIPSEILYKSFFITAGIGLGVKYIISYLLFGIIISAELPSFISQLQVFSKIAIVISYVFLYHYKDRTILISRNALVTFELMTAFFTTSKAEILFVVIAVLIGRAVGRKPMVPTFVVGLGTLLIYTSFLANYVLFVRVQYADAPITNVAALVTTMQDYFAQPEVADSPSGARQTWWARINFSNYQAFAITSYDAGRPGRTLKNAGWALVPRVLFPDKPVLNSGGDFSEDLRTGSSAWTLTAMTFFGYWNYGWWGVALVSIWAGIAYFAFTQFCIVMIQRGRVTGIAVAIFGIQMGYGVDGWFISGMVGGFALAMIYGLTVLFIESRFSPRYSRPASSGGVVMPRVSP
jgi:hypothetical protein